MRPIAGDTAVVAQSGNMGTQLLAFAEQQGIGIRGFAGSGNEAMLTIEDFLEGFERDELTRTVMLYVESVKQGRRFFENARRVSRSKPIVLLKGGQSQAGNRAAASHTGAMASDSNRFQCHVPAGRYCQSGPPHGTARPVRSFFLAALARKQPRRHHDAGRWLGCCNG